MANTTYMELENVDFDKLRLESVDLLTFFDRRTGEVLLMMEDLKDFTISNSVDTTYQTGKLGVRLSSFDRNKAATMSGNNAYVIASALAAQVGSNVEDASEEKPFGVMHVDKLEVGNGNTVTLNYEAVGMEGGEFPYIYKATKDLTQGQKFAIGAVPSETEFAYDPETRVVTLPMKAGTPESSEGAGDGTSDEYVFQPGDVVIIPYTRKVMVGKKISNNADLQAKTGRCVLDCTGSDICDPDTKYHVVIEAPNAKIQGSFDLAFGDEPMQHPFGVETLPDPCSLNKDLWNLYVV